MKPIELLTKTHSLLSDRVRLAIMATLASASEPMDFNTLLSTLDLTKGNLASHIKKLEEGKLLTIKKEFIGKKTRTSYRCTSLGRQEVKNYLEKVESLLKGSLT